MSTKDFSNISVLLEAFFTDYLVTQRRVSEHTIASYRDTFRLLLNFAKKELGKSIDTLMISDFNALFVRKFLNHLEEKRAVSPRTRNQRLAAIHSCFRYAALLIPENCNLIGQVLAIPSKRHERQLVKFLDKNEIDALLAAPNTASWDGMRDYTLMLFAIQTGLRVSEITNIRRQDIHLGTGAHVRCFGKGRKERCTPLTKQMVTALKLWLRLIPEQEQALLFLNAQGNHLSTDGVQYILNKYRSQAAMRCPSLLKKKVSPHVLRHTAAMQLLLAGVDRTVIALWLGHESVETTLVYLEADLKMKEDAINKTSLPNSKHSRFKPKDTLLSFLNSL